MPKKAKKKNVRAKQSVAHIMDFPDAVIDKTFMLRDEVRKNTGNAIVAAFAFIMALVWRDVIRDGIDKLIIDFGIVGNTYYLRLFAAFLTTIICVIGIWYFSKWSEKPVDNKNK